MKKYFIYCVALAVLFIGGCQKEESFELGNTPAEGSLQSDVTGDCLPKLVTGNFEAGKPLVPAASTLTVGVNVTRTGTYVITTDTVNGFFFRATGTFTTLGVTNVIMRSSGTPFTDGIHNFVVSYNGTVCDVQVTVLPAGAGGADFTLAGSPNCTTPVISGSYTKGIPLTAANTVELKVNVTSAGTYNITLPAANGMTFSGSGTLATGAQTIKLTGSGTPTNAAATVIPITNGSTTCSFTITVTEPAAFVFGGAPGDCTTPVIAGTYTVGAPLTAANKVTLNVTVTTAGGYTVTTTTVGGMTFSKSGSFASTGPQTIDLTGVGTPTTAGDNTFSITYGTSACNFKINVGAGADYTIDCGSAVPNGTYTEGVALTASNTVTLSVNVTTAGPYTITTTPINGITFSKTGTFATTGSTTIDLVGTGTPVTDGTFTIAVPSGTTPCTFDLDVDPAATIDWKFTEGATTFQGSFDDASLTVAGPTVVLDYNGSNSTDQLIMLLTDINGTITAGETYSSSITTPANALVFSFVGATKEYDASPAETGVTLIVTITTHNTTTKTITGTFAGTVKDEGGATKTITGGTFTGTYN